VVLSQEHVRYSLELSALKRCLDESQRMGIAKTAIAMLARKAPTLTSPPSSPTVKPGSLFPVSMLCDSPLKDA
jgi:hypothetical protein